MLQHFIFLSGKGFVIFMIICLFLSEHNWHSSFIFGITLVIGLNTTIQYKITFAYHPNYFFFPLPPPPTQNKIFVICFSLEVSSKQNSKCWRLMQILQQLKLSQQNPNTKRESSFVFCS